MKKIIIGTRGSDLALWQAHHVQDILNSKGLSTELKIIKTSGDQIQHLSFDKMEGKGFFTKEIESALSNAEIDIAVHSHKDLETTSPDGLTISAVLERENPAELLLIRKTQVDQEAKFKLKKNAIVGTSSARRKSQLLSFREDLRLKDLRGNVPTRIEKLRNGDYDAIMLAKAGVSRLNIDLSDLEVLELDPREFIPAPAQGVLGIQTRENDHEINKILSEINVAKVATSTRLERAILKECNGGCQLPLGVYVFQEMGEFHLWVAFAKTWNGKLKRSYFHGTNLDAIRQQTMSFISLNDEKKKF